MHGDGTYTYATSKDIYSGSWSEGKRHGQGIYEFSKDKSVLKGNWKLGEFEEGEWIMTDVLTDRIIYSGKFRHGKPIGEGKFSIGQTSSVSGTFIEIPASDEQGSMVRWCTVDTLKM